MSGSVSGRSFDRRTVLMGGLATAASGVLASCGSSASGGGSRGDKKLTMMVFGASSALDSYLKDTVFAEFTESTGYKVELQKSDWASAFQKIVTAAASGTMPDVTMVGGIWTAPLASKHALLKLDDLLTDWTDAKHFYPAMIDDGKYDGATYALPLYSDTRTTMYRSDLLKKAGVAADALPTNWDQFKTVAEQVKAAGIPGLGSAVDWGQDASVGLQQAFAQLFLQAGGTYYDDKGRAQFSSQAGHDALQYLTSFYRDGLADVNMVYQGTGAHPVVAGRAAMTYAGYTLTRDAIQNAPAVKANLIAGPPLSSGPGRKPVTSAWINKLGISAKTKDPEGAFSLVQHFLSKANAEKLADLFGGLPTRRDLADAAYLKTVSPALVSAAEYIVPQPPNPNMLTIAPQMATFLQKAIRSPADYERILKDMDAKVDQINGV